MKKIIVIFFILSKILYLGCNYQPEIIKKIKNGEVILTCHIRGKGVVNIPPEKVVNFHYSDRSYWEFTNGSASNCETQLLASENKKNKGFR